MSAEKSRQVAGKFHRSAYDAADSFDSEILHVRVISGALFEQFKEAGITKDAHSVVTIFLISYALVCFHIGSLFVGTMVIIQIVMSIPISLLFYTNILGIPYFCQLHLFTIIIILGIGADDVFVFHDQWTHTKRIKVLRNRLALRMAYTFRKASNAMLITSVTTAVSFLATGISPIMPLVAFGVFSALVVVFNYLLILLALPSIYLLYEVHIAPYFKCFKWIQKNLKRCIKRFLKKRRRQRR